MSWHIPMSNELEERPLEEEALIRINKLREKVIRWKANQVRRGEKASA